MSESSGHFDQAGEAAPGDAAAADLAALLAKIGPPDAVAAQAARDRQARLTKPPGALGELEQISIRLAALAGRCPPPIPESAVVAVFAGDHGVHAQGVSPWPQEVTAAMVAGICAGTAAVSAIARQVGARVVTVDVAVATELPAEPALPGLLRRRIRCGTADLSQGPAMDVGEAVAALLVGAEVAEQQLAVGTDLLLTGDMGIGNTTASAALVAAFTGAEPEQVTGRGTGIDDETWQRKVSVVRAALLRHREVIAGGDPVAILAAVGGVEHAAIAGLVLAAAAHRVPVILDGVIAGSAALVAQALAPDVVAACFAGHRSVEQGHTVALGHLGLRPLIDLDLRLGEGTGALLALPIVASAARGLREMATFDEAGITG